uniref:Uncharacterized protein LOC104228424 n=1 Tax=Nicotiana sylvestris TaxID=4096 RepID=A0A1U7WGW2_NICSY|nr:PREDICTED: uncharacterized protein LOC104228424 [Nicotiana sylvestris]
MVIKLVVGEYTLNVISAYALHAALDEEVKQRFWEGIDEIVRRVPPAEKLFIEGDFKGHIGVSAGGYGEVHGGFGVGERNGGGTTLLDFAKALGHFEHQMASENVEIAQDHASQAVEEEYFDQSRFIAVKCERNYDKFMSKSIVKERGIRLDNVEAKMPDFF